MKSKLISLNMPSVAFVCGIAIAGAVPLKAITLDLTGAVAIGGNAGAVSSGVINGGYFNNTSIGSTGTGVIQSFVRLQAQGNNSTEQGYNATARPVMSDVNTSPQFTHDLQIANIPVVTFGAGNPGGAPAGSYYEFLLDVNQNNTTPGRLLSLDQLQLYTTAAPLATANSLAALQAASGAAEYDLDSGVNSTILLNYNINAGSGSGDMFAYIPVSALGVNPSTYVYLYSQFGMYVEVGSVTDKYHANDGFEEWAVRTTNPVNTPDGGATIALLGSALLGLVAFQRRLLS